MRPEALRDRASSRGAHRWAALASLFAFPPLALPALAIPPVAACTSSTECVCADRAIHLRLSDARASAVVDVTPSGAACAASKPTCVATGTSGACTSYRIAPTAAGPCHVDVDFAAGGPRFSADLRIVPVGGCCGGLGADPASAADVDVPDDGATDAGGA